VSKTFVLTAQIKARRILTTTTCSEDQRDNIPDNPLKRTNDFLIESGHPTGGREVSRGRSASACAGLGRRRVAANTRQYTRKPANEAQIAEYSASEFRKICIKVPPRKVCDVYTDKCLTCGFKTAVDNGRMGDIKLVVFCASHSRERGGIRSKIRQSESKCKHSENDTEHK